MNRVVPLTSNKKLPSIKDLFPSWGYVNSVPVVTQGVEHIHPISSGGGSPTQAHVEHSSTIDSFLTATAHSSEYTSDHNYTLSSGKNATNTTNTTSTSCQSPQDVTPPSSIASSSSVPLISVVDMDTDLQRLVDITKEIESLYKSTHDFSKVPSELLYNGCTRLNQIKYAYEEWTHAKEREKSHVQHCRSFQNMEEQAVKALTSMNETHVPANSSPSSLSVSSETPFLTTGLKRRREKSWNGVERPAMITPLSSKLTSPISPNTCLAFPVKRRRSNPASLSRYAISTLIQPPVANLSPVAPAVAANTSTAAGISFVAPSIKKTHIVLPLADVSRSVSSSDSLCDNECMHCKSKDTPEWRRGPDGERTLCNACGLFFAKLCKKYGEPKAKGVMLERRTKGLETDRRVSIGFV
ncbi:hypothetical protein FOA43_000932 [Brettanomyces nanus]|uniref:GATA-type domain-containing protein n=1 Tax=Eeniella nana TaxID=13502 RepID=A0A875RNG3_EENNA|nr:uncharacterized protein FOA43_000932 [Brettanomyces nanus]QPG73620.1 hypothetical protein FOA43_000932 [Brettanomyces nanus]